MLQLRHKSFKLAYHQPFTTGKGTKTHQETLVIGIGMRNCFGLGEAPAISYNDVTVADMEASLAKIKAVVERQALIDPKRFWHFLHHLIPGQHFLTAALDIAAWDLFAQLRKVPLHQLLELPFQPKLTNYTIGKDSATAMLEKVKAKPWPAYKIKITAPADIETIALIRQHTDAIIRIDANETLSYEDTKRLLPEMEKLGVQLLEQPLHRNQIEEMKALKAESKIKLIADESCQTEDDLVSCFESFHGINIKLSKCGGITPALRMIDKAKQAGQKIMLGTMTDCTIGTAALGHLSAAADYLDADGPLLLAEDVATGIAYENGNLLVNGKPGLGLSFSGTVTASNL